MSMRIGGSRFTWILLILIVSALFAMNVTQVGASLPERQDQEEEDLEEILAPDDLTV
jgi:hypothetical protein